MLWSCLVTITNTWNLPPCSPLSISFMSLFSNKLRHDKDNFKSEWKELLQPIMPFIFLSCFNRETKGLTSGSCPFSSVKATSRPLKRGLFTVPAFRLEQAGELSKSGRGHAPTEVTESRRSYGRQPSWSHAKAETLCINYHVNNVSWKEPRWRSLTVWIPRWPS